MGDEVNLHLFRNGQANPTSKFSRFSGLKVERPAKLFTYRYCRPIGGTTTKKSR